jgi:hypothetical protein
MIDTLLTQKEVIPVNIIDIPDKTNWEPYFLFVATLSLIVAVIIPFAQKKYDEYRTKRSFTIYLKKQLGFILNFLTSEKIEYHEPSIKKNPDKVQLELTEFIKRFEIDLKKHKEAVQPKIIFTLIMNLQKLLLYSFHLRNTIRNVEFKELMKLTLEHGDKLSKKELSNIYGLIVVLESFISISLYHDRFAEIKSIKRLTQENVWVGLKLDKDFLEKQEILNDDLQYINDNESSITEITFILRAVEQKVKEYFDYEKNMKRR